MPSTASEFKASDMRMLRIVLFEKNGGFDCKLLLLLAITWSGARGPWGFSGQRQLQETLARLPGRLVFLQGMMRVCLMANDKDKRKRTPSCTLLLEICIFEAGCGAVNTTDV